jgi:hypothetical protein
MSERDQESRRVLRIVQRCALFGAVGLILLVLVGALIQPHEEWGFALFFWPVLALLGACAGVFVSGWVAAFHGCWLQRHQTIDFSEESSGESSSSRGKHAG